MIEEDSSSNPPEPPDLNLFEDSPSHQPIPPEPPDDETEGLWPFYTPLSVAKESEEPK